MSMEKAIEKINSEMQKDPNNAYLEIIGHYLIDRCSDEQVCTALLNENKTLAGAFTAVENTAKKKAIKNCAVMKDMDIFDAVDQYFGLAVNSSARADSIQSVDGAHPMPTTEKPGDIFNLSLESFL